MNKIILSTILIGASLFTNDAEALKVKLEPSITFKESVRHAPRPARRVVRRQAPNAYRYYDPYTGMEYWEYYPEERYEYYEYYCPHHHSHSSRTDFQLRFKFR